MKYTRETFLAAYAAGQRDFTDADLRGADLRSACLRGADLTGADLTGANLSRAILRDAILRGANLSRAILRGADLTGAILSHAILRSADLRSAILRSADLRNADLRSAILRGAIGFRFSGAPDPIALRKLVASHIEAHPELHDQGEWGDGSADAHCGTPCCVAGWACHLGGGARGHSVPSAALRLLWVDGLPMPSFASAASREDILAALRG